MRPVFVAGIVLGVLCVLWTFVMGFTGWYKDPVLLSAFYLVIPIEVGVLVWGLRQTAREGRRYGAQVGSGTLISLIGGVIIFFGSILFTAVVFPDYFEELRLMTAEALEGTNMSPEEMKTRLEVMSKLQTPLINALFGFIGTVVTGVLASLIIAAIFRQKDA